LKFQFANMKARRGNPTLSSTSVGLANMVTFHCTSEAHFFIWDDWV
jgi:hypothetical protein